MKLLGDQKVNAGWYHYSARHRIALTSPPPLPSPQLSSGSPLPPAASSSSTLPIFTFYFKPNKIIKMPRFDVDSDGGGTTPLTDQVISALRLHLPFFLPLYYFLIVICDFCILCSIILRFVLLFCCFVFILVIFWFHFGFIYMINYNC